MLKLISRMPFYAVARGRHVGIFENWPDCQRQVTGFQAAKFKKFATKTEAEDFIQQNGGSSTLIPKQTSSTSADETHNKRKLGVKIKFASAKADNSPPKKIVVLDKLPSEEKLQIGQYSFTQSKDGYVQVYTDGSCEGNGKANACAGLGVYFGEDHKLNLSQPVSGRPTNNCGEIQASIEAIRLAKSNGIEKLQINTDSQFLINAATKWMAGWKKKDWKTASGGDVKNKVDFMKLDAVMRTNPIAIKWQYVEAHVGILGNERADALARKGAEEYRQIFKGGMDEMLDDF